MLVDDYIRYPFLKIFILPIELVNTGIIAFLSSNEHIKSDGILKWS